MKAKLIKKANRQTAMSRACHSALLASFVFVLGCPLRGEDQLLKEYIYLDGKLLAVERQAVTMSAQQLLDDAGQELKLEYAANWLFLPAAAPWIPIPALSESSTDGAMAGIGDRDQDAAACIGRQAQDHGGLNDD